MMSEETYFFDVIKGRRTVRKFKPDEVPPEHIEKILDAARLAPTSGNQQPWRFLVVRDRDRLDRLREESIAKALEGYYRSTNPSLEEITRIHERFKVMYADYFSAPVFIFVLVDTEAKYAAYNRHDGPLAASQLMLAARALGYGSAYLTDTVSAAAARNALGISKRYKLVCSIPVGLPVSWPDSPPKKSLEDVVFYETIE